MHHTLMRPLIPAFLWPACLCLACSFVSFAGNAQAQIVNNGAAVGTSLSVSTLTSGTSLQVSGAISADGRYVTMGVDPQFSQVEGFDTIVVNNPSGVPVLQAIGMRRLPFRPAQVGKVIFVDKDKALLAASAPAINLPKSSLKAAVHALAEKTNTNIVLGIRGLEDAGINPAAANDFSLAAGTLKESLLAALKTAAPDTEMVITADDHVITVATQAQADNNVITKTYFLEDLLANVPRWVPGNINLNDLGNTSASFEHLSLFTPIDLSKPAGVAPAPATRPASAAGPKQKPQYTALAKISEYNPSNAFNEKPQQDSSLNIVTLITSTVRPDIWKPNGGKIGEIGVFGNHVTIRAPQSVHAILEGPKKYDPNKVPMYVDYTP